MQSLKRSCTQSQMPWNDLTDWTILRPRLRFSGEEIPGRLTVDCTVAVSPNELRQQGRGRKYYAHAII